MRRNGVAKMEKPNPVLVCKMEATKMIAMKMETVSKQAPLFTILCPLLYHFHLEGEL